MICATVVYVANEMRTLRIAVTEIRAELDVAKPAEVLEELRQLRRDLADIQRVPQD
jgi:hypothetical protein